LRRMGWGLNFRGEKGWWTLGDAILLR
jgi:hypothetical protein